MTTEQLDVQMGHVFQRLVDDLRDEVPAEEVLEVSTGHFERLRRDAAVNDFIPLLVYRFTREQFVTARPAELHAAA